MRGHNQRAKLQAMKLKMQEQSRMHMIAKRRMRLSIREEEELATQSHSNSWYKYKEESQKRYEEEVINTRNRSVYDILSQKTKQMYLSCIVLHYRADKLKDYVRENL